MQLSETIAEDPTLADFGPEFLYASAGRGCDHSNGGAIIGAQLQAAGYKGVFRYAAAGRGNVNITAREVADLKAHGIAIAIVNEHSAAYLLGGYATGRDTALAARDVCRAAGLADGVIYMGGDSELLQMSGTNLALVASAMDGAAVALGQQNAGYYGSAVVIDYLVRHRPWIRYYWQTVAWSGGWLHPRANALQRASTAYAGGVQLDIDDLLTADWGQRGGAPPPPPTVPEATMHTTVLDNVGHLVVIKARGDGTGWFDFTHQDSAVSWANRTAGYQAGLTPFAPPLPEPCVGLSAYRDAAGVPNVIAEGKSGRLYYTFQQDGWNGGVSGQHVAAFVPFAPAP
jgi:Rv2525c-like, glycoside hydrolase-like domain